MKELKKATVFLKRGMKISTDGKLRTVTTLKNVEDGIDLELKDEEDGTLLVIHFEQVALVEEVSMVQSAIESVIARIKKEGNSLSKDAQELLTKISAEWKRLNIVGRLEVFARRVSSATTAAKDAFSGSEKE